MKKLLLSLLSLSLLFTMSACNKKDDIQENHRIVLNEKYSEYYDVEKQQATKGILIEYGNVPSLALDEYLSKDKELLEGTMVTLHNMKEELLVEEPIELGDVLEIGDYYLLITDGEEKVQLLISVRDTIAPEFVKFSEKVEFQKGDKVDLTKIFNATDLTDVVITIEGEVDFNKAGEYKVKYIATDKNGNKTEKESTVVIKENEEDLKNDQTESSQNKDEETKCSHAKIKTVNKKEATCTKDGYTGDKVCEECNKTIEKGKTLKATGHNYSNGTCKTCGAKESNNEEKECSHEYTETVNKKDATCTADGYSGDKKCKSCGKTVEKGKTVKATGHSYDEGKCKKCGAKDPNYVEEKIPESHYNPQYNQQVLDLINAKRAEAGVPTITYNSSLQYIADARAKEVVSDWSHDGLKKYEQANGCDYGEILAYGYGTPKEVINGWMNSSGHKNAMLADYQLTGTVSSYYDGYNNTTYWVVIFTH